MTRLGQHALRGIPCTIPDNRLAAPRCHWHSGAPKGELLWRNNLFYV